MRKFVCKIFPVYTTRRHLKFEAAMDCRDVAAAGNVTSANIPL